MISDDDNVFIKNLHWEKKSFQKNKYSPLLFNRYEYIKAVKITKNVGLRTVEEEDKGKVLLCTCDLLFNYLFITIDIYLIITFVWCFIIIYLYHDYS